MKGKPLFKERVVDSDMQLQSWQLIKRVALVSL